MLTGPITGIDPFVNWSTFKGPSLTIPRGLFYGGIFYTAEEYTPPCHISYIAGRDEVCLSTWGIADADGKELAQIYFYDDPDPDNPLSSWGANVGHIIDINGAYSGCLKGRLYHYYDTNVSNVSQEPSDLVVFLNNLSGEYILDDDSLVLDVCACSGIPKKEDSLTSFEHLQLPADCSCVPDQNGFYYVKKVADEGDNGVVKGITFNIPSNTPQTISGARLTISPYTMPQVVSGGVIETVSSGTTSGGRCKVTYTPGSATDVGDDIGIDIVDGGIVVGRRGRLNELSK